MALSFSNGVAATPDVMFRMVGDEIVLLNLKTELYLGPMRLAAACGPCLPSQIRSSLHMTPC